MMKVVTNLSIKFLKISAIVLTLCILIVIFMNSVGPQSADMISFVAVMFIAFAGYYFIIPITVICVTLLTILYFIKKQHSKRWMVIVIYVCKYTLTTIITFIAILVLYLAIFSRFINYGFFTETKRVRNQDGIETVFVISDCGATCRLGYFECKVPSGKKSPHYTVYKSIVKR
jgi:hypothetical protein